MLAYESVHLMKGWLEFTNIENGSMYSGYQKKKVAVGISRSNTPSEGCQNHWGHMGLQHPLSNQNPFEGCDVWCDEWQSGMRNIL